MSVGYEAAPATRMLATQCAVCGRPLVDSISVDVGIGPDCRRKYGYDDSVVTEDAHAEANKIVHDIAVEQSGLGVAKGAYRLRQLGFDRLASVIEKRACKVLISMTGDGRFTVKSPYSEDATASFRRVPGRRWDSENKVNTFPADQKRPVFDALVRHYRGLVALGPKGPFVIGGAL